MCLPVYSSAPQHTLLWITCQCYSIPRSDFLCAVFTGGHIHTCSNCYAFHNTFINFPSNNPSLFFNTRHLFLSEMWLPVLEYKPCTLNFKPKLIVSIPQFSEMTIIFQAYLPHLCTSKPTSLACAPPHLHQLVINHWTSYVPALGWLCQGFTPGHLFCFLNENSPHPAFLKS